MTKRIELIVGQPFGKLRVESFAGNNKSGHAIWNCVCVCGNHVVTRGDTLTTGRATSCGKCPNKIESFGDSIVIWLEHKGYEVPCFIDAADYPLVKDYRWHASSHEESKTIYARSSHSGPLPEVFMHTVIAGKGADHVDNDGLNNRRENLRLASHSENMRNKGLQRNNTIGFKGVVPRRDRFVAKIKVHGKQIYLGTFDTALEAARAYNEGAKKYHGEFAVLNDVGDHDLILNQKPEAR